MCVPQTCRSRSISTTTLDLRSTSALLKLCVTRITSPSLGKSAADDVLTLSIFMQNKAHVRYTAEAVLGSDLSHVRNAKIQISPSSKAGQLMSAREHYFA